MTEILDLLGMYFDAAVVEVKKNILLFTQPYSEINWPLVQKGIFIYLVGADGPSPGVLLALAGSSLLDSDLVDLLRSFALQKKDKNFLPKTIRTTMKAVAITIITMTKGILAAPSVLNGYRTALSGKEDFKRNIRICYHATFCILQN